MAVRHTDASSVAGTRVTDIPVSGQTISGYGGRIPTRHMIRYLGVWRRVYVMVYSNLGSAYIRVRGENVFLDTDTEHRLMEK